MKAIQVPEERSIFFESVNGPPAHEINLSDALDKEQRHIGASGVKLTFEMSPDHAEFADEVGHGSMPRVDQSLLVGQARVEWGSRPNALGMIPDSTWLGPRGGGGIFPREAGGTEFADMTRRLATRKSKVTIHARVLPELDAIVQSDWQGQLAPTYQGEANNEYNEGNKASKRG